MRATDNRFNEKDLATSLALALRCGDACQRVEDEGEDQMACWGIAYSMWEHLLGGGERHDKQFEALVASGPRQVPEVLDYARKTLSDSLKLWEADR